MPAWRPAPSLPILPSKPLASQAMAILLQSHGCFKHTCAATVPMVYIIENNGVLWPYQRSSSRLPQNGSEPEAPRASISTCRWIFAWKPWHPTLLSLRAPSPGIQSRLKELIKGCHEPSRHRVLDIISPLRNLQQRRQRLPISYTWSKDHEAPLHEYRTYPNSPRSSCRRFRGRYCP